VASTKKLLRTGIQIRDEQTLSPPTIISLFDLLEDVWTRFLREAYEDENPLVDLFKVLKNF